MTSTLEQRAEVRSGRDLIAVTPGGLTSRSYIALAVTQFLGAFNDNMFRWLAVPIGQMSPQLGVTGALVLGGVCFTLPYLLLAPLAGSLADRFSKRTVIIACKVAEIVLMLLGVAAIVSGNLWFLFGIVTLMGSQSALFAPAKCGSLPEMLTPRWLSAGNGVMGMVTVVASALGTVAGFWLFVQIEPGLSGVEGESLAALVPAAVSLVGVAIAGTVSSLMIARLPAAAPARPLQFNPVTETAPALRLLFSDVRLARTALGIAFFWMLASLSQLNIDPFGGEVLGLDKEHIGVLMAVLVAGLGFGSVLAGYWSGGKVELGIVPMGALGIVFSSLFIFLSAVFVDPSEPPFSQWGFFASCLGLFLLGTSAGLFDIPLEAYLQYRSDDATRGTILAGSNFVAFSFILLSCGLFFLMDGPLGMTSAEIFMVAGLLTIPVAFYVLKLLPTAFLRFIAWLMTHSVYRVRIRGGENIPEEGGALIVANHITWVDGLILLSSTSRMVRFLIYADYAKHPLLAWVLRMMGVIPIKATSGPRSIVMALNAAREAVQQGELVCIFPEGSLTRTGQLQSFNRGMLKIVEGTDIPIIPAYLHGLWGSIFSYSGRKFFWKRPRQFPYPVAVHFGTPIHHPESAHQVRQIVEQLGTEAVRMNRDRQLIPVRQFIRQCKRRGSRLKIADSSGVELSGRKTLIGALTMQRALEREVLAPDEQTVGILLPPSVGGAWANVAVALSGRTSANLNYTLSDEVLNHCVREAGIRHVLTSRRFLEKKPVDLQGVEFVYLEDVKEAISGADKALSAAASYLPSVVLDRLLGLHRIDPDSLLTIIFTSGSTGEPKGVMLSHANIGANIAAVDQILNLTPNDSLLGVLPFFHSFGYTVCLWLVLCFDAQAAYHYNPLDAKMIGTLTQKYRVTILLATPTFLKMYMKRCSREQFASLDLVVVGAEKLPQDLAKAFEERFGIFPTEGYGTTELSPVASCNVPDHRGREVQIGTKAGTVGRPIPGVSARVVDPETFEDRGIETEGLLLIGGANVMQGYLNHPEKTSEVIREGWYVTGDFAKIDRDGFIEITGRMSRFSKIGGEMVPHLRIEQELCRIVESNGDDDCADLMLAVTAVPDSGRGERLIVLHRKFDRPVEEVLNELRSRGLPNLWLPDRESFIEVEAIPLLGTGKLDLRGIKELALQRAGTR